MPAVTATIGKDHYQTIVRTPTGNSFVADEPLDVGGGDTGAAPEELLCASLAACAIITMRLYADKKQWPLESLEMTVTLTRNADNTTQIHKELTINGELSEEERQRLLQIADKCPVHKILSNPISFSSVISS